MTTPSPAARSGAEQVPKRSAWRTVVPWLAFLVLFVAGLVLAAMHGGAASSLMDQAG